ncbi:flagellar export chaperone FlgN, partial [Clostridioides difficile]
MITDLKVIIYEEKNIISKMMELLKEQFDYIVEKDLENLNMLNPKLEDISRELASIEIKRRQLFGDDISMSEVVEN